MVTWPPKVVRLDIITWSPTIQSCAIWTHAKSKQSEPTIVLPDALVPLFIVTNSLMTVLSPISATVFSSLYLRSCGTSPIDAE